MTPLAHSSVLAGLVLMSVIAHPAQAQDGRALALESKAHACDASLLSFRGHDFHPGFESSVPPTLTELLSEPPPTLAGHAEPWLVQSSLRPARSGEQLRAAGFEILERIPNSGWLVRAAPERAADLACVPGITWTGRMTPAHVVMSDVLARVQAPVASLALDPSGLVPLRLDFLPRVDARLAEPRLRAIPGVSVVELWTPEDDRHSVRVGVSPAMLRGAVIALARIPGASALMTDDAPHRHVDDAVWSAQTGIDQPGAIAPGYDVSAKLFARGITGQGMLIGLADDGLENDNCRFRYGPAVNEACWPLGPSNDMPDPLPAEQAMPDPATSAAPLRTRDRKVVIYYRVTNSAPYSSFAQHGTTVASIALGDDYEVLAARPLVRDLGFDQLLPGHQPAPTWAAGQLLRPDLASRVDDPSVDEPTWSSTFAGRVEHHQPGDGVAPGAQLIFHDIGDAAGGLVGFLTESLLGQSYFAGATTFNASFGQGACASCYVGRARDADRFTAFRRDMVIVASAGNDGAAGAGTIASGFAHAKNAIVIGATEAANSPSTGTPRPGEDILGLSGRGPRSGGMLAPDLVAPGELDALNPLLVAPEDGTGSGDGDCGGADIRPVAGTSFAAPVVTGAAALVQQYFMDGYYPSGLPTASDALRPTNALVRAVLINSARDLQGSGTGDVGAVSGHRPSFGQGWGAPRLDDTLYFAGDPIDDDPRGDTERAGLVVLTDTPNGCYPDARFTLSPEPGGRTRDAIVASFRWGLLDGEIHEFTVDVGNPDPSSPANELRFTLAWSDDASASSGPVILENDLDLEVVSPGPDGMLQSVGGVLAGDDVLYRPDFLSAWSGGFTMPVATPMMQAPSPPFTDFSDRESLNTVENVFIASADVRPGPWLVRVIGYQVPMGFGGDGRNAYPNFIDGDSPPVLDTDGDGVSDREANDEADQGARGYALLASGRVSAGTRCAASARVRSSAGPRPCAGDTIRLDASSSWLRNCAGSAEYRFESPRGTPIPGGDWAGAPVRDFTAGGPGPVEVFVLVRCSSDPACASTSGPLPLDVQPIPTLDFPGPVMVTTEGDCRLRVSWNDATSSAAPIVYDVYRDATLPVTRDAAHLVASNLTATTWLDDVPWGAPSAYRVVARVECADAPNAGGDSALTFPIDVTPPAFGGIVDTRDLGFCQVEVTWDETTAADSCSGIAGFNVYRDHGVAHAGETLVASLVPSSPYIDTTPGNGTWVYVARAVNGAGLDDGNSIFQQESEGSCTNDFPRDAGLDREDGVDPPRADRFRGAPGGGRDVGGLPTLSRVNASTIDISWIPSPDEGGLYPVTYSVMRGALGSLLESTYDHALVTPDACGIPVHGFSMPDQVDGISHYYLVVAVSGDNATFGYDSFGREIAPATACE